MPNKKKIANTICILCSEGETEHMVQCDACDNWYHYECVGVNSGVADVSWSCHLCTNSRSATTQSSATTPSTLQYQPLSGFTQQPQASSSPASTLPAGRQNALEIINQIVTGDAARTRTTSVQTTTLPIFTTQPAPVISTATSPFPFQQAASSCPVTVIPVSHTIALCTNSNIAGDMRCANMYTYQPTPTMYINQPTSTTHIYQPSPLMTWSTATPNNLTTIPMMTWSTAAQKNPSAIPPTSLRNQQGLSATFYKESATFHNQQTGQDTSATFLFGPSPSQLAARQVIPKELPIFNGDPEEWPLFLSCFENSTALAGYSNGENLMRLQASLKGKAREIVRNKLLLPDLVPEIIQTLKMCFGRPEHILECMVDKARKLPPLKDKLEGLIDFALCVGNICCTMEACQLTAHLNNPMLVKELVDKLPPSHKLTWAMQIKDERVPAVKAFSSWLNQIAEAASQVVSPYALKKSGTMNTHVQEKPNTSRVECFHCKSLDHKITRCQAFDQLSYDERWTVVKEEKLCRTCLNSHRRRCYSSRNCGIGGCTAKHHPLLHKPTMDQSDDQSQVSQKDVAVSKASNLNTHNEAEEGEKPYFRIIPIRIHSGLKSIDTFAFLDEGSSVTLMEKDMFTTLGLKGNNEPLCLRWTGDTTRADESSQKVSLQISNLDNNKKFWLNEVHTVENLCLPKQSLNMERMVEEFPHLTGLPIRSYANAQPTVLIGADNWKLAVPLKIKEGSWYQPIATKTRLGWTLQGCAPCTQSAHPINIHSCDCKAEYEKLHETVKTFFALESSSTVMRSKEDEKALETLDSTCRPLTGRFEVGLLWRNERQPMPDSYETAYRRLMCLHKKFKKDPCLKEKMQKEIDNLLSKGYSRKLTADEVAKGRDRVWYLPIFVTTNPNKPNRIRLVWDAAAKSKGKSLNDFMLTGPDLLTSLVEVLLAFRVGEVAICGDIEEMFHQIRVREEDMHAQRFLWWDKDDEVHRPSVYVMSALTFGINCAPCIAHFIRNKNADQHGIHHPRAVEAIKNYHYVDDFIDSMDSEIDALDLAKEVKTIHSNAGFNMRNWSSNSTWVAEQLNGTATQAHKALGSPEKILGMYWDPNNDTFRYIFKFAKLKRDVLSNEVKPTKRETLQVLMSVFDPLGFLACFTISLKILLQDIWRAGIGWDEELPDALYLKWLQWKSTIPLISSIEIPRCYSRLLKSAEEIQLHTFVDAGEYAYAAVCFLRIKYGDEVAIRLVASKSKVAPLKPISIPRLELQAAVLGLKLSLKVQGVQRIPISSRLWWSDSKTVLKWLRMDPRNLQQFVMFRVGELLEHSNVTEWKWVPSKLNSADLATKASSQLNSDAWFRGPAFLLNPESDWPTCDDLGPEDKTEVRNHLLCVHGTAPKRLVMNVEYFADWRRLYRALATFLLFMEKSASSAKKRPIPQLSFEMLQKAKVLLYRYAQESEYSPEIKALQCGKKIEKNSKLISLNPYIDNCGVLRSKGRIEHLNSNEDAILLPKEHHVTFLIVRYWHEYHHHVSHETTINKVKGMFHIPRLRVLYKTVRNMCQRCKNNSTTPNAPLMASVPAARLAAFERPFTFVGIDYFGPIYTIVGRRREKRWGVIFTCLTVRAVHIEVAHSLDTSSCVMCIRNFMSRRGMPREIYTDNGTNFKATEKILREECKNIDYTVLASKYDELKWKFNPPAAPHMGGAWERLVRSIKTILYSMTPIDFNDESLRCALWEVEFIINSRPLTFVSLDSCDDEAITPNHLLLGSSGGYKPVCNDNFDLRQRWTQTQLFADRFWRRWINEYKPILARRGKWFTKQPPLVAGDVVVIVDENLPRNCWPKGVIESTMTAKDGQVRRVMVRTQSGMLERPASKIAVLDVGKVKSKLDQP